MPMIHHNTSFPNCIGPIPSPFPTQCHPSDPLGLGSPISPEAHHLISSFHDAIEKQCEFFLGIIAFSLIFVQNFSQASFQHTNVAPPVSMASISARSIRVRRNRAGSSLRSKNSPFAGVTGPSSWPETPPISPVFARPRGPCCWACCL